MHVLIISHIQFRVQLSLSVAFFFRQTLLSDDADSPSVLQDVYNVRSVLGSVGNGEGVLQ
jgi:hypothetical protein